MFGSGSGIQDQMLKAYVDKIFDKYDTDRSGTLDQYEMTIFFNDLFKQLNINKQVKLQESLEAIRSIDKNFDGNVDRKQLFLAFKLMLAKSQQPNMTQSYNPYNQSYPQQPYGGYNPYQQQPYGYYPPPPQYGGYPQSPFYQNQNNPYANGNPQGQMYQSQPQMYGGGYNPNMYYSGHNPYQRPY